MAELLWLNCLRHTAGQVVHFKSDMWQRSSSPASVPRCDHTALWIFSNSTFMRRNGMRIAYEPYFDGLDCGVDTHLGQALALVHFRPCGILPTVDCRPGHSPRAQGAAYYAPSLLGSFMLVTRLTRLHRAPPRRLCLFHLLSSGGRGMSAQPSSSLHVHCCH